MPIFKKNGQRAFFIHIPKTGGTSIEEWIKNEADITFLIKNTIPEPLIVYPQHLRHTDMRAILGEKFYDWAFAVVREPYKRLESEYHYRNDPSERTKNTLEFSEWVILSIHKASENPTYLDNHIRPQSDFLADDVEVFKLEDGLDIVSKKLLEFLKINTSTSIGKKNSSKKSAIVWTDEALAIANDFYAEDFSHFNYPQKETHKKYQNISRLRKNRAQKIFKTIPVDRKIRRMIRKLFRLFK